MRNVATISVFVVFCKHSKNKIASFQKEAEGMVAGWNFKQVWDDSLVALHVFLIEWRYTRARFDNEP